MKFGANMARFQIQSIGAKFALLGVGGIVALTITLIVVAAWQSRVFNAKAQSEVEKLVDQDLAHVVETTYQMVHSQDALLQQVVEHNLNVARHLLKSAGGFSVASEMVTWNAVNQFSQQSQTISLPKVLIGGAWLGQQRDPNAPVPLVDKVRSLVGGTCTIFQRMNEQGDMLRVATNVIGKDGKRAIGTFIPAVNPDGTPNPVVSTVLRGETYRGVAFVVDSWYVAAYEPIRDASGRIIGMLYAGVKTESVDALRKAIMGIRVGKDGYIAVLGGKGHQRGRYIISLDGKCDGENIWEAKDSDGRFFIQEMVNRALELKPGETFKMRYPWKNKGETKPRMKVAMVTYYAPWDWVIAVTAYEDDFGTAFQRLQAGRRQMLWTFVLVGLIASIVGSIVLLRFGRSVASPLNQMVQVASAIADGRLNQQIQHRSTDETGTLAEAFRRMLTYMQEMAQVARRIAQGDLTVKITPRSEQDELGQAFSTMVASLRETTGHLMQTSSTLAATSQQLAAATEQSSRGAQDVAKGNEQLARTASEAAQAVDELESAIQQVKHSSETQKQSASEAEEGMKQAAQAVEEVARSAQHMSSSAQEAAAIAQTGGQAVQETIQTMSRIQEQAQVSAQRVKELDQLGQQIGAIVETIEQIAEQTNLLALNAAIEAARAGEHGRGFAVVADEVRKLAEQAASSTKEIGALIASVRHGVEQAVQAMEQTREEVESGFARSTAANEALAQIVQAAQTVASEVQGVTAIAQQMSASVQQVLASVSSVRAAAEENVQAVTAMSEYAQQVAETISTVASVSEEASASAQEISASAEQVSAASQELSAMAMQLQQLVQQFQLEEQEGRSALPRAA
ncbi:MAG: Cache 3/Cache 2 fusion domain-containing protein [Chthonomonadetes bacterium]|nr:Cache 3/Cache 2 fusion domain-containing protein [Chthonomonadetes bacterium]